MIANGGWDGTVQRSDTACDTPFSDMLSTSSWQGILSVRNKVQNATAWDLAFCYSIFGEHWNWVEG